MCLAIYKPKGKQIAKQYLQNGYDGNSDGCGFAFVRNGNLCVEKGFKTFDAFLAAFLPIQRKHACIVHFRFATHGSKTSDENTHPIIFGKHGQYALIHNGMLNIATEGNKSDTVMYAERVLAPALERFEFSHPALKYLVETSIGHGNKFVVMRCDGKVNIFNEGQGHWHKGIWYSNNGYKERAIRWTGCQTGLDFGERYAKLHGRNSEWTKRYGKTPFQTAATISGNAYIRTDVFDDDDDAEEWSAYAATDDGGKVTREAFPDYVPLNERLTEK